MLFTCTKKHVIIFNLPQSLINRWKPVNRSDLNVLFEITAASSSTSHLLFRNSAYLSPVHKSPHLIIFLCEVKPTHTLWLCNPNGLNGRSNGHRLASLVLTHFCATKHPINQHANFGGNIIQLVWQLKAFRQVLVKSSHFGHC